MKTYRPSFLLSLLALGVIASACASPSDEVAEDDPDMTESEIGSKPAPRGATWEAVSLPRGGLDGDVSIDDITFAKRPDGTPVTRDGGKPIVFVIERIGMKRLSGVENGNLTALVDPGVALLLRSDDGGATFSILSQLPGLGVPAHIRLPSVPRGSTMSRVYIEAPGDDTGMRGGPPSYHSVLLRSEDSGRTFTSLPGERASIEVDAQNPDVLTGIDCQGIQKSTNGGAEWSAITQEPAAQYCEGAELVRTKDPKRFYAIYGHGDFGFPLHHRSDDGGKTFYELDNVRETFAVQNLLADDLDANHVWGWDSRGFVSSGDGARTLLPHNRGLVAQQGHSSPDYDLSNLAIDDLHKPPAVTEKHTLWFANGDRLVRWSPDNGPENGEWKEVSRLPGRGVHVAIAGRGNAPKPFAVVELADGRNQGLYRGTFTYAP